MSEDTLAARTELDAALMQMLTQAGLDALWVSTPENVRYLSGFRDGRDGKVLLMPSGGTLYTDARYTVQAREESRFPQFIARPPETLEHAAPMLEGLRVGFEAEHLTVAQYEDLKAQWNATLTATRGLIEGLRVVKSAQEIASIRAAQDIADAAFAAVSPGIVPGVSERSVALKLEQFIQERGGTAAFDFTVASGPRGAMPHGGASERLIGENDLITIDFGANVDGYHSDMTRTVATGNPSEELRRLYRAVLEAEEAAVAAVKPGASCADLDKLARDILSGHGLGEYFAHSLGHGVGLAIHEGPGLRGTSSEVLRPGMVVTIEPGVYVPGVGGVRIEDLLLVTEDGHEVLSHSPKVTL
ncbi:M24 family metallopeptidase [Deinococcus ruber]|uniref:M24 family metallopeptidase n=1 Tax=Deinococcus ruber TaxID=1848197 RepID=UPI001669043B|nr:Xaa-Pro peptidase family protein [Deinococcus ruber]